MAHPAPSPDAPPEGPGPRVADARRGHWTERLPAWLVPYAQLARWDRPIGWWLLLWPCWWSVGLAMNASGPHVRRTPIDGSWDLTPIQFAAAWGEASWLLALFLIGAVAMRGAGCTWNDVTDRHLDAGVARTRSRPLPSGRVSVRGALIFIALQLLVGLAVLLQFNPFAIALGFAAVPIVVAYPFAKRITNWPQAVLGLAFSWGALMGWAAIFRELAPVPLLLYAGSIAWTIGYDTIYAHQDREDDALMGVRSTARLFGSRTRPALVVIYMVALVLFAGAYLAAGVHPLAWLGLAAAAFHMVRQVARLDIDDADQCLALFRSNATLGWMVFGGLVLGWAARALG